VSRVRWTCAAILALLTHLTASGAARSVVDDAGMAVSVPSPPQRIVSLSPGITELLFALGVGARVVAVSDFSDYPAQALALPRVARAQGIDLERIAALRPDLVVTWGSGYSPALLAALRRLSAPVYLHEPRTLDAIATAIDRLGALTDAPAAPAIATAFRQRLRALREQYAGRSPVSVFYQVWASPVMTLTGRHLTSDVLRSCGARNVFEELAPLVATVGVESVLAARPQMIITAEAGALDRGALDGWRQYADLPAVARGQLVTLDADQIDRAALRILDVTQILCERVEQARHASAAP